MLLRYLNYFAKEIKLLSLLILQVWVSRALRYIRSRLIRFIAVRVARSVKELVLLSCSNDSS